MLRSILNTFIFSLLVFAVKAQTPGALITSPISTYLNPNGDSWVTTSGSAYVSNDQDESELDWVAIPQVDSEPSGDLNSGGPCGTTDIMDDPSSNADASYVLFKDPDGIPGNGDEYMLYRLRISRNPGNGNFGFSVLMDIDNKFGTEDPDSVEGNPGFEVEIRVKNGGGSKALYLDDVSGTTSGTNLTSYNLNIYTQKSYALSQNASCTGKPAVFYDFMVPFADLTTYFGMDINTTIRLVGATSQNGQTVLGSAASDIAGIDDDNYANSVAGQDLAFATFIGNQPGVAAKDATGFGVLPVELTSFTCKVTNGVNLIQWTTGMELNNDYFVVEKSFDGKIFFPIGEVNGHGRSTTEINYNFTDYNVEGKMFYRLKQVDFDGSVEYSKIIMSSFRKNGAPEILSTSSPNQFKVNMNAAETSTLYVFNAHGQVISSQTLNQSGFVNFNDYKSAIYVVKVINEFGTATQRVIVK